MIIDKTSLPIYLRTDEQKETKKKQKAKRKDGGR